MGLSSSHNDGYSREELLRYISGQMSAAEMYALEKAALEDPFLADALDGLQQEKAATKKHFADINQRLATRVDRKIVPMPKTNWWRIAVAAALIGFLGIAAFFFFRKNESVPVIAQKTEQPGKDSTIVMRDEMQLPKPEEFSADKASGKPESQIEKSIEPLNIIVEKDKKPKEEIVMPALTPASPVLADQESKKEMEKVSPSSAAADKVVMMDEVRSNKAMRSAKQRPGINEKMPGIYYWTGQVRDNQDKPVPFANIAIRNTQRTTYTDAKGNFRVVAGDSTLEVDIKSVGYLTRSIQLSNDQPNQDVVLQPARKVKAKSMAKGLEQEGSDSVEAKVSAEDMAKPDAEPRDGFAAYQFYLLNNVRLPAEAKSSGIRGSVDLSFLVNDNSRLSDFKIERSLGPAYDKEAIRLIRDGPPWVLYNSETGIRVKITVTF